MQKAIELDPKRSEFYVLLALFQTGANQPDQAEASFKKALEIDPKSMNAQLALGGFYQSRNRLPEAEQQFKHAIEMDPKNPAPRTALVRLFMCRRQARRDRIVGPANEEGSSRTIPRPTACSATSISLPAISTKPPPNTLRSTAIIPKTLRSRRTTSRS